MMYRKKYLCSKRVMSSPQAGKNFQSGYTIIELIVSTAVIGVLIAIAFPAIQNARDSARRVNCLNNMRNVSLAIIQSTDTADRFPASGYYGDGTPSTVGSYRSWVVEILPYIDQANLYNQWDVDKAYSDPHNTSLANTHIPVITCPDDYTLVPGKGNITYVVSGGVGFTALMSGIHDCPVDTSGRRLDLNGNGITCNSSTTGDGTPSDREIFKQMGLFFNETWKGEIRSSRHHNMASITDGLSNTVMISENLRTGFNPKHPGLNWSPPFSRTTSFFIGNPCSSSGCSSGNVDYSRSNSGNSAINAGISKPEGTSPYPSSSHPGGVNFGFCDGRVQFVSQNIDGIVYASLVSPQGQSLDGTPLAQQPLSGGEY